MNTDVQDEEERLGIANRSDVHRGFVMFYKKRGLPVPTISSIDLQFDWEEFHAFREACFESELNTRMKRREEEKMRNQLKPL